MADELPIRISGSRRRRFYGTVKVPGDKAVAHRLLILASMARGRSMFRGVPRNDDLDATISVLRALGIEIEQVEDAVQVQGLGNGAYSMPKAPLDCRGSASTMRMIMGAVVGRGRGGTLVGDDSLSRRPMARVMDVLRPMGARFESRGGLPPVTVHPPDKPRGTTIDLEVPSAQVKTAVILAALGAEGRTRIRGRIDSRDHTERLVPRMGGSLVVAGDQIVVEPARLDAIACSLPADPSSAAFFLAGALLLEGSRVEVPNVLINPTRTGFIEALKWMGAELDVRPSNESAGETSADITARYSELSAMEIPPEAIPSLVDEIPILALLASQARGVSVFHGVSEARIKETDRVGATVKELSAMGARVRAEGDDLIIEGPTPLVGAELNSHGDHRMAMTLAIAATIAKGTSHIAGAEAVSKSYPDFFADLESIRE